MNKTPVAHAAMILGLQQDAQGYFRQYPLDHPSKGAKVYLTEKEILGQAGYVCDQINKYGAE